MKKRMISWVVVVSVVAAITSLPVIASSQDAAKPNGNKADESKAKKTAESKVTKPANEQTAGQIQPVLYKPPQRGVPGGRVGGGTRGTPTNLVELFVLAPDHVALTTKEDPDLYWYISISPEYPLEISISEDQGVTPLLEKRIAGPVKAGLNRISLKDAGIKLSKGVQYRWFVALVPDESRRSKDLVAGSMIERVDAPPALKGSLSAAAGKDWVLCAQEGIWYDAIMALSESITAKPSDGGLVAQRDDLLAQVGLRKIGDVK